MSKSKDKKKDTVFCYDLRVKHIPGEIRDNRQRVNVCRDHFSKLCDMAYCTDNTDDYLPVGQKEYIVIKRLESQLGVINTIQFK
jgi:hypothetical protein